MRLFVGIPMPDQVAERLIAISGGIPGARWVARENYHLTLRFLGDTECHQAEDMISALSRIEMPRVSLRFQGLGLFGDKRRQRQLYADVAPSPELLHLNMKIEQIAQRAGYEPERRRFHPHVTVARMRNPDKRRLDQYLAANACFTLPAFEVDGFTLFRSHLASEGAIYEPIAEFGDVAMDKYGPEMMAV